MRVRLEVRWVGLAVAALAAAGCGGGKDAIEREVAGLQAELAKVRADNAVLAGRLDALERAGRPRGAGEPAPASAPRPSDRPDLEVVRLAPPDSGPPTAAPAPAFAPAAVSAPAPASAHAPAPAPASAPDEPRPLLRSTRGGEVVVAPLPSSSFPRRTP
jgi:hypothetical protein